MPITNHDSFTILFLFIEFFPFTAPCPSRPPIAINAQARFYSLKHGAKARYRCYLGFKKSAGDEIIHCQFGQWIGKPPTCVTSESFSTYIALKFKNKVKKANFLCFFLHSLLHEASGSKERTYLPGRHKFPMDLLLPRNPASTRRSLGVPMQAWIPNQRANPRRMHQWRMETIGDACVWAHVAQGAALGLGLVPTSKLAEVAQKIVTCDSDDNGAKRTWIIGFMRYFLENV